MHDVIVYRDSVGEEEEGETVAVVSPQDVSVRGKEVAESPKSSHQNRTSEVEGPLGNFNGPHTNKKAPSISIEPDTSLELTEEMVHGMNNVMTRDTPFAKASGSDKHETEMSDVRCSGLAREVDSVHVLHSCLLYSLKYDRCERVVGEN